MTDKFLAKPRNFKPMPSSGLLPLITIPRLVSTISEGKFSLPETFDALHSVYDPETLLYERNHSGLSQPIDGDPNVENSGYNFRADLITDIFNAHLWRFIGEDECSDNRELEKISAMKIPVMDIMISKDETSRLCRAIWQLLSPNEAEANNPPPQLFNDSYIELANKVPAYLDPTHPRYSKKLAAAVLAWEAVTESNGKSIKAELEDWLEKHAKELGLIKPCGEINKSGVWEVAKIANWDLSGGAPKTPG